MRSIYSVQDEQEIYENKLYTTYLKPLGLAKSYFMKISSMSYNLRHTRKFCLHLSSSQFLAFLVFLNLFLGIAIRGMPSILVGTTLFALSA